MMVCITKMWDTASNTVIQQTEWLWQWLATCTDFARFRTQQPVALQWRHNERDGVSHHQPYHCLLKRFFRRRAKKIQNSASLAFVREFTVDRWIPRAKGQQRGKRFHFITSSWICQWFEAPWCSCNVTLKRKLIYYWRYIIVLVEMSEHQLRRLYTLSGDKSYNVLIGENS